MKTVVCGWLVVVLETAKPLRPSRHTRDER
jgi:hypothetical protein